jgi:hypothetical protein
MKQYHIVSDDQDHSLVLFTAASKDRRLAMQEMKNWADNNQHILPTKEGDPNKTCRIEVWDFAHDGDDVELLPIMRSSDGRVPRPKEEPKQPPTIQSQIQ